MSVANMFKSAWVWLTNLFKTEEEIQKGVLESELEELMRQKNEEEEARRKQCEDDRFM
ncbi:hypothetical protein QEG29_001153 [Stenotrophomonas maltophilia]|nr:hypothetical protein [Stenotrophomonas maltophilia]